MHVVKTADDIVATMYVDKAKVGKGEKVYTRYLLRENYREKGKVLHRTIANLSHCSPEEIDAIRLALKHKKNLAVLGNVATDVTTRQGQSVGAVWALYVLAQRLGLCDALGSSRQGKLALWQVIARVIDQGSRLSAVRLASTHTACDILSLDRFDEDKLYGNIGWLEDNQAAIEDALFRKMYGAGAPKPSLFLYDVTSSYLEGTHNELGAFGYNRDGKRGKMQIVIGLLTNDAGIPISIELFKGNTSDPKTVSSQVKKVVERFGGGCVTFVGDRGMIRGPQIEELKANGMHYITAITKPQIEALLKRGVVDMDMFDENLGEVITAEAVRYILRRKPTRAAETAQTRHNNLNAVRKLIDEANTYLAGHPKAATETALRRIDQFLLKRRLTAWTSLRRTGERQIDLDIDEVALAEQSKLDGCYVMTTDLPTAVASKEVVHSRYKDLAMVEQAFRISKTVELEMRPVYVRTEEHTRGHALVIMLAYLLSTELRKLWNHIDITPGEGVKVLDGIHSIELSFRGKQPVNTIPQPNVIAAKLLNAADIILPDAIPCRGVVVATKKKLAPERKTPHFKG
ncbi:MAG: IS1634 family transposase [Candidatus Sumerlaeota bacterium]|nr:IS1634 family transposase [Candidatus Sumerlaeota bacterium]